MSRTHRILIGVVVAGALVIAAIGFAGSYAAVRALAEQKGFGAFSYVFPIGIDAGIVVLLALDLLLTWIRIPFPLLRQTAWLLTAATIAFNGAAAWPDPLGVGMHAVIPVLFVVAVEAARHAVGRIADLTADKHMEGVRLSRWLLAPASTFRLWRRMKLWELRSYEQVIKLEQDRLVYQARLRSRYGRAWRRKAPVEAMMPLRLARYGVPLAETVPAGLAAAGLEPAREPQNPVRRAELDPAGRETAGRDAAGRDAAALDPAGLDAAPREHPTQVEPAEPVQVAESLQAAGPVQQAEAPAPAPSGTAPAPSEPAPAHQEPLPAPDGTADRITVPVGPGRSRPLGNAGAPVPVPEQRMAAEPGPEYQPEYQPQFEPGFEPEYVPEPPMESLPDGLSRDEQFYVAFRSYVAEKNDFPDPHQFARYLLNNYGVTGRDGVGPLSENYLRTYVRDFRGRFRQEMETEHIA
ncbi:DUF2637 domain-containing protein [Streptomyces sp. NPDC047117]|uniref:DUF2637 domain-containing protein n=1 Tax=Streptomyces sp. NPDC047117 TaxID=3155379 RepID=UPI0033F7F1C4